MQVRSADWVDYSPISEFTEGVLADVVRGGGEVRRRKSVHCGARARYFLCLLFLYCLLGALGARFFLFLLFLYCLLGARVFLRNMPRG